MAVSCLEWTCFKTEILFSDETTDDRPESSLDTLQPESEKRFSEFLGGKKRYSEFLGGKKRYSEFLGGKKRYSEFLGGKKRYSEFLGGKKRYSEFLGGKKRYSEFLGGKKRDSEFIGGKKRFVDAFGPTEVSRNPYAAAAKRFSEFLGGKWWYKIPGRQTMTTDPMWISLAKYALIRPLNGLLVQGHRAQIIERVTIFAIESWQI